MYFWQAKNSTIAATMSAVSTNSSTVHSLRWLRLPR